MDQKVVTEEVEKIFPKLVTFLEALIYIVINPPTPSMLDNEKDINAKNSVLRNAIFFEQATELIDEGFNMFSGITNSTIEFINENFDSQADKKRTDKLIKVVREIKKLKDWELVEQVVMKRESTCIYTGQKIPVNGKEYKITGGTPGPDRNLIHDSITTFSISQFTSSNDKVAKVIYANQIIAIQRYFHYEYIAIAELSRFLKQVPDNLSISAKINSILNDTNSVPILMKLLRDFLWLHLLIRETFKKGKQQAVQQKDQQAEKKESKVSEKKY